MAVSVIDTFEMKLFPEIDYFSLDQMAETEHGSERNLTEQEDKEDEDEFSTYFLNRVNIPDDGDKV